MSFLDTLNKVDDVINKVTETGKEYQQLTSSYKDARGRIHSYKDGSRKKLMNEVERIRNKSKRFGRTCMIIWALIVISTIVLCITGNDIVLRVFGL